MMGKVVLAYSGGLDSTVMLTLLKEKYRFTVVPVLCSQEPFHFEHNIIRPKSRSHLLPERYEIDLLSKFLHDRSCDPTCDVPR